MQVGDLVMWLGKDEDNGCIGIISKVFGKLRSLYSVVWSDGTSGSNLQSCELKPVDDK
jgi:rRNA processing protein Gar1